MSFADVENKTDINPQWFSAADKATILAAMRTAYEGSATARAMFDSWIAVPANRITIDFLKDAFQAPPSNPGRLQIDLDFLTPYAYIDNNGTAVKTTVVTALVHELVHALMVLKDDGTGAQNDRGTTTDYRGATVIQSNIIYRELGLPEQNSYIAHTTVGDILTLGFKYTNGAAIDRSFALDDNWDSSAAGNSNDLLIGGISGNTLSAGDGNDFLYGNGGNDTLDGGADNDTLDGGAGTDILKGGTGTDTYYAGNGDTIEDIDRVKGVSIALFSEPPCHVAHALS